MTGQLIVECRCAGGIADPPPASIVIVSSARPGRRCLRGRRSKTSLDTLTEQVSAAPRAIILARRTDRDLCRVGRALERDLVRLPDGVDAASWVIAVAVAITRSDRAALLRALDVLCNGPEIIPAGPSRPWGAGGLTVPALRPSTLAKWAVRAWEPCSWCSRGGLAGRACGACGTMVVDSQVGR